jgi:hypothetical protein
VAAYRRCHERLVNLFELLTTMKKQYAKCENGLIHLVGLLGGGERTLCGDAFEGHCLGDKDDFRWTDHKSGPVTCPRCADEIENCRGVKIHLANSYSGDRP